LGETVANHSCTALLANDRSTVSVQGGDSSLFTEKPISEKHLARAVSLTDITLLIWVKIRPLFSPLFFGYDLWWLADSDRPLESNHF